MPKIVHASRAHFECQVTCFSQLIMNKNKEGQAFLLSFSHRQKEGQEREKEKEGIHLSCDEQKENAKIQQYEKGVFFCAEYIFTTVSETNIDLPEGGVKPAVQQWIEAG